MAANFIHVEVRSFNKNPFHKDYGSLQKNYCILLYEFPTYFHGKLYFYGNEKNYIRFSNPLASRCFAQSSRNCYKSDFKEITKRYSFREFVENYHPQTTDERLITSFETFAEYFACLRNPSCIGAFYFELGEGNLIFEKAHHWIVLDLCQKYFPTSESILFHHFRSTCYSWCNNVFAIHQLCLGS